MGIISASGAVAAGAEAIGDAPEPEAPEIESQDIGGEPETPTESRRARAQREREEATDKRIAAALAEKETKWQQQQDEHQRRLREIEQRNAMLEGQVQAFQRMPQQPAAPAVPEVDPADLRKQARQRLNEGKLDEYEELIAKSVEVTAAREADKRVRAATEEFQRRMPQQMDPFITDLLSRHKGVRLAGDRGRMVVNAELGLLHASGAPQSAETMEKAFELAEKRFEGMNKPAGGQPSFTAPASAVAGLPTNRAATSGATAGGEGEAPLTKHQQLAARAMKVTDAEYRKWMDPTKHGVKKW